MNLKNKLIGDEEERAVSPVIGVILMVAITVILAAVIAAFVLDLGGSVGEEAQASVNVDGDETTNVSVAVSSLGNADGVFLVNPDGTIAEEDNGGNGDEIDLDGVGQSVSLTSSSEGELGGIDATDKEPGSYNVVAYIGEGPNDTETETVIRSFELE